VDWDFLINAQEQNDFPQIGGAFATYPVFHGMQYQRGAGIGAIFKTLLRFLLPLGKEAGAAIGRQGLESTSRILGNVLEGKPLKDTLKNEARSGVQNLLHKAANRVGQMEGSGKRRKRKSSSRNSINSGKKAKRSKKTSKLYTSQFTPPLIPNTRKIKSLPKKQLRFDSLGPY
jgi:hypothetical protein